MGAGDWGRAGENPRYQVTGVGYRAMPPRSIGADFMYEIPRQIETQMKVRN